MNFDPIADPGDVWARRRAKRLEGVRAIRRSFEYMRTMELVGQSTVRCEEGHAARIDLCMPLEPDPYAKLSKRTWERSVQVWRKALRAICATFDQS